MLLSHQNMALFSCFFEMSAFGVEVMTVPLCQRICSVFYVHLNEKEKLKDRKKNLNQHLVNIALLKN